METVRTCSRVSSGASPKCGREHLWGRPPSLRISGDGDCAAFLRSIRLQEVEHHRAVKALQTYQTYQTWQRTHFVTVCHSSNLWWKLLRIQIVQPMEFSAVTFYQSFWNFAPQIGHPSGPLISLRSQPLEAGRSHCPVNANLVELNFSIFCLQNWNPGKTGKNMNKL